MQHCEFCGSELPVNARFCGHCGRTPGGTTKKQTDISAPTTANLPPLNAPTALGGQSQPGSESEEEEERRRRPLLLDLPFPAGLAAEGQPAVGNVPIVQGTQMSGVPVVQGTPSPLSGAPNAAGLSQSAAPNASAFSQSAVPSPPSPAGPPQAPGGVPIAPTGSPTPLPQTEPPHPPPDHHHDDHHHKHHRARSGKVRSIEKGVLGSIPRWLLILIIAIIIAAGGGGVLATVLHTPFSSAGGSSSVSSSSDHTGTAVTQGKTKGKGVTAGTTPTASPCASNGTPVATGSGGTHLFFAGSFPCSPMTAITYNSCSISTLNLTGKSYYSFIVRGTIDGTQYEVSLEINVNAGSKGYTGPGTYTFDEGVAFHQVGKPLAAPYIWDGGTGTSGKSVITINGGENSGSVYAVMPPDGWSGKAVTISGNWTCGNLTRSSS